MEPHQAATMLFCETWHCPPINIFFKRSLVNLTVHIKAANLEDIARNGFFVFGFGGSSCVHYRCCGGCGKPHNSRIPRYVSTLQYCRSLQVNVSGDLVEEIIKNIYYLRMIYRLG
jgi:hypothetical protein